MLDELRVIFYNPDEPLGRRIEAASLVLQHDAPEALVTDATEFLETVAKSHDSISGSYRIDAIKALAKRQVPKAGVPGPTRGDRRAVWQRWVSAQRRMALWKAGEWTDPPPKGWDDDIYSPDWIAPEGDPPWSNGGANEIEVARLAYLRSLGKPQGNRTVANSSLKYGCPYRPA